MKNRNRNLDDLARKFATATYRGVRNSLGQLAGSSATAAYLQALQEGQSSSSGQADTSIPTQATFEEEEAQVTETSIAASNPPTTINPTPSTSNASTSSSNTEQQDMRGPLLNRAAKGKK